MSLSRLAWPTTPARPAPARNVAPAGKAQPQDGFDSLVKYIPTETITIFVALCSARSAIETVAGFSYWVIYLICAALTPVLLWLIALGRHRQSGATTKFALHWWPLFAATIAFLVWALSVPGVTTLLSGNAEGQAAWGIIAGVGAVVISLILSMLEPVLGPSPSSSAPSAMHQPIRKGNAMTDNPRHFCATPVPPNKVLPPAQAYNPLAAFLRASLWNAGDTIRIRFIDGSPTLRDRVKAVASEWLEHANLTFAFVESGDAHIRIAFIQGDGSWSYVGTDCNQIPADEPTMNYGWLTDDSPDDEVRQVVLHEFGHAIGMIHEHQNPEGGIRWNRDAVIADLSGPPNYWNDQTIENNMFKKYEEAELVLSKLDKTSIMMYPIPASWTEGGYFSAGLNNDLSATDKAMAKEAYPN